MDIKKRLVETEVFESELNEVSIIASGEVKSTSGTSVKAPSKSSKSPTKTAATKTVAAKTTVKAPKTSTASGVSNSSKTKTSAIESTTAKSENDSVKILLLFAASILSFGLGLSISRLFLPERRKWISSGGSDESP